MVSTLFSGSTSSSSSSSWMIMATLSLVSLCRATTNTATNFLTITTTTATATTPRRTLAFIGGSSVTKSSFSLSSPFGICNNRKESIVNDYCNRLQPTKTLVERKCLYNTKSMSTSRSDTTIMSLSSRFNDNAVSSSYCYRNQVHKQREKQRRNIWQLGASSSSSSETDDDFEPTWTYVPYDPAKNPKNKNNKKRQFSTNKKKNNNNNNNDKNWKVPKPHEIRIPEDQLEMTFVRSSGSGGQNVNKLNTKVDIRFHVQSAKSWIPYNEVRERLQTQQKSRMTKDGYLQWSCQEHRTQLQNKKTAISKLQEWISLAYVRPKIRKQRKGISKAAKEKNKENKRRRSSIKAGRRQVTDW